MSRGIVLLVIAVVTIAIAIPVLLYLTYPTDEYEFVEQAVEHIYGGLPKPVPRFVPGVVGYVSLEGDTELDGVFILTGKRLGIIRTKGGEYIPMVLMPRYRCINGINTVVLGDDIAKLSSNRSIAIIARVFRTPRGITVIPIEIRFEGTRCIYLRR